jgi:glycosyltransferase involved in cell wall biosynthesis
MRMALTSWLGAMAALDHSVQFEVLHSASFGLPDLDSPNVRQFQLTAPSNRELRIVFQNSVYPILIATRRADVLLATCNVLPLGVRCPSVVIVPSIQCFEQPESYGRFRLAYLRRAVTNAACRADIVICLSEHSRAILVRETGASPTKVHVVPHGLSPSIAGAGALQLESDGEPYILYLSTLYAFKNHHRLLEAYTELRSRYGVSHRLRLIGGESDVKQSELQDLAVRLGVADYVDFLGARPHGEIARQYTQAALTVFPSLYETFGHPPLEAMACGSPVVASNVTSIPEVVGDAAELVDPYDPSDIARGMARVLGDPRRRSELIAAGRQRATMFTWELAAAKTLQLIRLAAGQAA